MIIIMQKLTKITALLVVHPICGKHKKFVAHLQNCMWIPPDTQEKAISLLNDNKENALPISASSNAGGSPLKGARTHDGSLASSTSGHAAGDQTEFSEDLCQLFVACRFAWGAASNPQIDLFVKKWIPGVVVPDRRILLGWILDTEVKKIEAWLAQRLKRKLATGQCDSWDHYRICLSTLFFCGLGLITVQAKVITVWLSLHFGFSQSSQIRLELNTL